MDNRRVIFLQLSRQLAQFFNISAMTFFTSEVLHNFDDSFIKLACMILDTSELALNATYLIAKFIILLKNYIV